VVHPWLGSTRRGNQQASRCLGVVVCNFGLELNRKRH
jgi:hypothetical protein